jgi:hypothetical protein
MQIIRTGQQAKKDYPTFDLKLVRRHIGVRRTQRENVAMITTLVQFRLPKPITLEKAREIFLSTAPRYRETPGLIRKYYVLSEDGGTAGGVYLWKSRKDAQNLYTQDWENYVQEKYGAPPSVTYFQSPVVVDNVIQEIIQG